MSPTYRHGQAVEFWDGRWNPATFVCYLNSDREFAYVRHTAGPIAGQDEFTRAADIRVPQPAPAPPPATCDSCGEVLTEANSTDANGRPRHGFDGFCTFCADRAYSVAWTGWTP